MTKVSMPIIGWVSEILGWMINVIYSGLEIHSTAGKQVRGNIQ